MGAAPPPDLALPGPLANPPADAGRLDAGAFPGPLPHDRPSVAEQARSTRSRLADLCRRAEGTRQRAAALMKETTVLMLAAEQIRPMARKELLSRSEYARLLARAQTMPVIEQAKGILMAQSGCDPEEAFDVLRRASQRSNVPVRELAAQIVAKTARESRAGSQHGRRVS